MRNGSKSVQGIRSLQALPMQFHDSPYSRPLTTGAQVSSPEKNTIIWKDFLFGVRKRKDLIRKLNEAALESTTPMSSLKTTLLDLRMTTLTLIEDALEIEYRARIIGSKQSRKALKSGKLPPITSYRAMEEKEDIYALVDIISDVDDLFLVPNIRVMLPMNFPNSRNPFLLGKDIDELATLIPPHPEPGNAEEELKVLELLRYKRASRALIRAEAQILNRLPMDLYEIENWLQKMNDDYHMEKLLRAVCTLLDNDRDNFSQEADLTCLRSPTFNVEAHELLRRLNMFQGAHPMRVDVQVAVRQHLRDCTLDHLEDSVSLFLIEWMELVLQSSKTVDAPGSSTIIQRRLDTSRGGLAMRTIEESVSSPKSPNSSRSQRIGSPSKDFGGSQPKIADIHRGVSPKRSHPVGSAELDEGLISTVEDGDYLRTHEKIFTPEIPKKKMQIKSFEAIKRGQKSDQGVGPDSPDDHNAYGERHAAESDQPFHSQHKSRKIQGEVSPMKAADDMPVLPGGGGLKKKIRNEIEKVMKDLGFFKNNDETEGMGGRTSMDALSSVRYELNKMQQELLRRQVLDPRHYAINSVDAMAHAKSGLTVVDVNAFDPMDKRGRKRKFEEGRLPEVSEAVILPVALAEKKMKLETKFGELELILSILMSQESKSLFCSISMSKKAALLHGFIREPQALLAIPTEDTIIEMTHFEVSQLVFSKLTDHTFDDFMEVKSDMRPRMLQNVFNQLMDIARTDPLPRGQQIVNINRVLFNNKFSEDNVLVDLTISRNVECNGITLHCTPIAGLFHAKSLGIGPIVLTLLDKELEVLLICQHGMFKQAMKKWKSLEILAQWLAGRVRVKKVAAASIIAEAGKKKPQDTEEGFGGNGTYVNDEESVTSQLTFTARNNDNDELCLGELDAKLKEIDLKSINHDHPPTCLLMLEVTVDRKIDISQSFLEHWKSRNVPKIVGLEVGLNAFQDLEVMVIDVSLTLPGKRAFKKMKQEAESKATSGGLMNMDNYSDDDDDPDVDGEKETKFILHYRLTRAELLTFGSCAPIDNKKISMSKNTAPNKQESHPEDMIWNILSRLKIAFKGSRANPYNSSYSAAEAENWKIEFDRLLLRDVKTVTQHVMMMSVTTVGGELHILPEPMDTTSKKIIQPKRISEAELESLVNSEGWAAHLLDYIHRKELAKLVLGKLKVFPCENSDEYQLELYTYVESRMIIVARAASDAEVEEELGAIEINSHHTLGDLRIMIKHEFDPDDLPNQYRFLYKGLTCSLRQESFRRAWECLPCIYITPKETVMLDMGVETDDIEQKRVNKLNAGGGKSDDEGSNIPRLLKGQRRVPGRYYPLPVTTLCIVQEGESKIYTLHEANELFVPGDIIRIGSTFGRDYVIQSVGSHSEEEGSNYQVLDIVPEYNISLEPDFQLPIHKNFAFPDSPYCGMYHFEFREYIRLLKTAEELGFQYKLPSELFKVAEPLLLAGAIGGNMKPRNRAVEDDANSMGSHSTLTANTDQGKSKKSNQSKSTDLNLTVLNQTKKTKVQQKGAKSKKKISSLMSFGSRVFVDCWMWKCVPGKDDPRPKWRQMYDNGQVPYLYEYKQSEEFFKFYRVKALYAYMEVLCTDSRCPTMTYYHQRVNEMRHIIMDFYTKTMFDCMTDWAPQYKRGVERVKFIKLIKDVNAFPDLKRPARVAQLDMYFAKFVKSAEYGIVQKYLTYNGLVVLIKQIAVLRFPPKKDNSSVLPNDSTIKDGDLEDDGSVGSLGSVGSSVVDDDGSVGESGRGLKKKRNRPAGSKTSKSSNGSVKQAVKRKGKLDGEEDEQLQLKNVDQEHIKYAYEKFILEFLMMYPGWYDIIWREAKLMAMKKEAIIYCAATRIAAIVRGLRWYRRYREFIRTHTILQANIRRKLSNVKVFRMIRLLQEDWCYRVRYHKAMIVQSWIRRFVKQCWFERMQEQKKKQEVILCKARRQKRKKFLEKTKKPIMFKEVKRINGVTVMITVTRNDPRNYTRDYGIMVNVYIPDTQDIFKFPVSDLELREYMALLLEVPICTAGQLLDKRNLQKLLGVRLVVHKASQKHDSPVVIFSKHALGQKGEHTFTRGKRIHKEMFICKIYETVEDVAVQLYHRLTCKVFTLQMLKPELHQWIKDDMILQEAQAKAIKDDPFVKKQKGFEDGSSQTNLFKSSVKMISNNRNETSNDLVPFDEIKVPVIKVEGEGDLHPRVAEELPILQASNKQALYFWILNHIMVDKRRGTFKLIWSNHYERSQKREMIIKIQSVWRKALVRPTIIRKLDEFMLKIRASPKPDDDRSYYLNVRTGASTWIKPFLLGKYDLTVKPSRRWVPVTYMHQGMQYVHYVNPYTGKFTHYSVEQAVRKIQALVRNHLLKPIKMPFDAFLKAGIIFKNAHKTYEAQVNPPRKLSSVINYALVLHSVLMEEVAAKDIYREAVELSEANPLVTRSYAFYLLGTCEAPLAINRDRAIVLLLDAKRKDPDHKKFTLAYNIFQFAVLRTPKDYRVLLNLGLIQCLLFDLNYNAEKLFRRALAYAPFEERTIELWKYVKDRFPERHIVYNPLSRVHKAKLTKVSKDAKLRMIHGRPVMESGNWAGWVYVPEDPYNAAKTVPKGYPYWYNPADGTESLDPPDFDEQWKIRKNRSHMEEDAHGLEQYFDPLTSEYFTYHPLTDTFAA